MALAQTINLFRVQLFEGQNQVIEDIFSYLTPIGNAEALNRLEVPTLDMTVKVKLSDTDAMLKNAPNSDVLTTLGKVSPSYAIIRDNTGTGRAYEYLCYFVRKVRRISNNVSELTLHMDVLNTYFQPKEHYDGGGRPAIESNPAVWQMISGSSQIKRRHKDRFEPQAGINPYTHFPKLDRYSENFSPPLIEDIDFAIVPTKQTDADYWVMYYYTPDKAYRPNAFFAPQAKDRNHSPKVHIYGEDIPLDPSHDINTSDGQLFKAFRIPDLPFNMPSPDKGEFKEQASGYSVFIRSDSGTSSGYENIRLTGIKTQNTEENIPLLPKGLPLVPGAEHLELYGSWNLCYLELGYGGYETNQGDTTAWVRQVVSDKSIKDSFQTSIVTPPANWARKIKDPKLTYGEFSEIRLTYDSDSISLNLLDCDYDGEDALDFTINLEWDLSTLWNGNQLYKITFGHAYKLNRFRDPYQNILQVSKSNEDPLVSSSYLEYMKSGYNFDQKQKNLSLLSSLTSSFISAGGAGAGLAIGNVGGAVGAGVTSIQTFSSALFGQISGAIDIEKKKAEASAKGSSVSGINSNDLLPRYNKPTSAQLGGSYFPIIRKYSTPDYIEDMIDDYFYFYGYADNTLLSQYGNFEQFRENELMSRYFFNYIEMNIVWKPLINPTSPTDDAWIPDSDILDEIKRKFAQGVTFFHKTTQGYDFDQTKENYERWLLE